MSELRKLRRQRRLMVAEMIGVMLDHPRSGNLDPELRCDVEKMMNDPKALDAVVAHLLGQPPPSKPPYGLARELLCEWARRLEEREQGGQ